MLQPIKHPLATFLTSLKDHVGKPLLKAVTNSYEFRWLEDFYGGRYAKVSGTYSTGAVTITVTGAGSSSAYIFTVGDIIRNYRTGENMKVATIASSTTITIASGGRAYGTTAAAAGADGDGLYIIGNVNEENATARNVNMTQAGEQTNYTQIFKRSMAVSGTEKAMKLYGGDDLTYQRGKLGTEHGEDIERSFLFGEKKATTGSNSLPERATGGILERINSGSAYVQDQGGILTAPDLDVFLREGFTYGSPEKILMCGGKVLGAINEMARGQLQMVPTDKTYGIQISKYVSAHGIVNLLRHPLLVNDWAGYGFLLDLDSFRYRYVVDRDTKLETNIQASGTDGQVDQYLTECGLERKQIANCALIKNVEA